MCAMRVPKAPSAGIFKDTYKHLQGVEDAIARNIGAVTDLGRLLKSSFGPHGRKKLIVNHLEKLFVTADAATITRELDVVHPAAKMLVMASQAQESEMGDGTNLVNVFACELLQNAEALLRSGLHPTDIATGYEAAMIFCLEKMRTKPCSLVVRRLEPADFNNVELLRELITPVVATKQPELCHFLAPKIAEAMSLVMPASSPRDFSVDSVRVVKILGGSVLSSTVIKGMVFGREPEGSVRRVEDARVAIYSGPIDIAATETKGTVLLRNADELLGFSAGEESRVEAALTAVRDAGVNVIVAGSTVTELALHFCNRLGIMVVRVPSKFDLRRLCRVTGSTALLKLAPPSLEELGRCQAVETVEIGGDRCVVFRQHPDVSTRTSTLVLRGATPCALDDIERAVDDAVNSIKALTRDPELVAGAGACELELARLLTEYAASSAHNVPGASQPAVLRFAEALECVARSLAESAGYDATEVVARAHAAHQSDPAKNHTVGVVLPVYDVNADIEAFEKAVNGESVADALNRENDDESSTCVRDAVAAKILDPAATKARAIQLASETALTLLRVDQIIMARPAGGPKLKENKHWDDD